MSEIQQMEALARDFARRYGGTCDVRSFSRYVLMVTSGWGMVIGHGNGSTVGAATGKDVARELQYLDALGAVETVFVCSCRAAAGPFAQDLKDELGSRIQVWAATVRVMTDGSGYLKLLDDGGDEIDPGDTLGGVGRWHSY
jgi:hypothetical protein